MVGHFWVSFLVGVLWAVYEIRYAVKYFAVLTFPSSPAVELCWSLTGCQSLGCVFPAVVNNLLVVHWRVTGALLLWAFLVGVFFILQGRRELASCGSDSYPMPVQLLEFAMWCALIESKWSTQNSAFHFLRAVFFRWLTKGFHLLAVRWEDHACLLLVARKCQLSWRFTLFFFLCCAQKSVLHTKEIFLKGK